MNYWDALSDIESAGYENTEEDSMLIGAALNQLNRTSEEES